MAVSTQIETTFDVDVEYDFTKGTRDSFRRSMQQHYPGDPPEVKIKAVYIRVGSDLVDIKSTLSLAQIENLIDEIVGMESAG